MKCPRCGSGKELHSENLVGIPLAGCSSCYGTWYEGEGLAKLLRLKNSRDLMAASSALFEEHPGQTVCPQCEVTAIAKTFRREQSLTIDQCPECHGVWFDAGELPKVKQMLRQLLAERGVRSPKVEPKRVNFSLRAQPVPKNKGPLPRVMPNLPPLDLSEPPRDEKAEARDLEYGTATANATFEIWLFTMLTGFPVEAYNPPRRHFPGVVVSLIAINFAVFLAVLSANTDAVFFTYGASAEALSQGRWITLFTHAFFHLGWLHLLGNMYFLWTFGDNVEDRVGHWQFVLFYLVCGLAAILCQIIVASETGRLNTPCVGASGAVAGVMGAYLYLFPRAALYQTIMFYPFKIPVVLYLGFWVLLQYVSQYLNIRGVAWWAHLGGFACGLAVAWLWYNLREVDSQ